MKAERNADAHGQNPVPIDDLTASVHRHNDLYYDRRIAGINSNARFSEPRKTREVADLEPQRQQYSRKIDEMMRLVKEEVGDFPLGEPS